MSIRTRKKPVTLSNIPINFKPFITDHTDITRMANATGKSQPTIARELISEALKARRLKAVGKDETTDAVVIAQKAAMADVIAPIVEELKSIRAMVHDVDVRVADEFAHAEVHTNFLMQGVKFIIFEVIICRILLRDYVHTVYKLFAEKVGRPVTDIEKNFKNRMVNYRKEAERELSDLTVKSADRLHQLADHEGGFDDPQL